MMVVKDGIVVKTTDEDKAQFEAKLGKIARAKPKGGKP